MLLSDLLSLNHADRDGGCNLQGGDQGSNQDKEAKYTYNYYKAYNYLRERREK